MADDLRTSTDVRTWMAGVQARAEAAAATAAAAAGGAAPTPAPAPAPAAASSASHVAAAAAAVNLPPPVLPDVPFTTATAAASHGHAPTRSTASSGKPRRRVRSHKRQADIPPTWDAAILPLPSTPPQAPQAPAPAPAPASEASQWLNSVLERGVGGGGSGGSHGFRDELLLGTGLHPPPATAYESAADVFRAAGLLQDADDGSLDRTVRGTVFPSHAVQPSAPPPPAAAEAHHHHHHHHQAPAPAPAPSSQRRSQQHSASRDRGGNRGPAGDMLDAWAAVEAEAEAIRERVKREAAVERRVQRDRRQPRGKRGPALHLRSGSDGGGVRKSYVGQRKAVDPRIAMEMRHKAVAERRAQRLRGRQQAPQPASDINQPAGDHRQRRSQRSTRRRSAAPSRPQVVTEDRTMVPPRRGSGDGPPSRYSEQHSGAVSAGGATPLQPYAARGSAPPTPPRGELRRSPLTTPERGGGDGSPARISDEARGVSGGSEEEDEDELGLDPALVEKRREIRRLRAEVQTHRTNAASIMRSDLFKLPGNMPSLADIHQRRQQEHDRIMADVAAARPRTGGGRRPRSSNGRPKSRRGRQRRTPPRSEGAAPDRRRGGGGGGGGGDGRQVQQQSSQGAGGEVAELMAELAALKSEVARHRGGVAAAAAQRRQVRIMRNCLRAWRRSTAQTRARRRRAEALSGASRWRLRRMREAFAALRALHDRARMNNVAAVMMQKRKAWHTADRVFREWRAFAKACAQERESELAIIAFRRQRAAEQRAERYNYHRVASAALCAWVAATPLFREERLHREAHERRRKQMDALVAAAQSRVSAQEQAVEEATQRAAAAAAHVVVAAAQASSSSYGDGMSDLATPSTAMTSPFQDLRTPLSQPSATTPATRQRSRRTPSSAASTRSTRSRRSQGTLAPRPPTPPEVANMRKRAAERKQRRAALKQRYAEAQLQAEEEARAEEVRAAAEAAAAKHRMKQLEEEAAAAKLEAKRQAAAKRARARAHARHSLLVRWGWRPWCEAVYLARLRVRKADFHWRQTLLQRCFDSVVLHWQERRNRKAYLVETKLHRAAVYDRLRLKKWVLRCFNHAVDATRARAAIVRRRQATRVLTNAWGVWIVGAARRASFRAAERRQRIQLAALKGAKVLKRRMLLRWQEGMRVQAGERARDARQQRLWSKVQAWLPGDLDAM